MRFGFLDASRGYPGVEKYCVGYLSEEARLAKDVVGLVKNGPASCSLQRKRAQRMQHTEHSAEGRARRGERNCSKHMAKIR